MGSVSEHRRWLRSGTSVSMHYLRLMLRLIRDRLDHWEDRWAVYMRSSCTALAIRASRYVLAHLVVRSWVGAWIVPNGRIVRFRDFDVIQRSTVGQWLGRGWKARAVLMWRDRMVSVWRWGSCVQRISPVGTGYFLIGAVCGDLAFRFVCAERISTWGWVLRVVLMGIGGTLVRSTVSWHGLWRRSWCGSFLVRSR